MVNVILRDGRVIRYNVADRYHIYDDWVDIKSSDKEWCATFPREMVERIEFSKPCEILSEPRERKRMKKYK